MDKQHPKSVLGNVFIELYTKAHASNGTMLQPTNRHELNIAALEGYLVANVPGFKAPLDVKQFKHGQSNPTYLIKDGK